MNADKALALGFNRVDSFVWFKDAGDGVVFKWFSFMPKRIEIFYNGKYQKQIVLE